jgi:alpha-tubulin suppressor-like RCC1 family protein
MRVDHGHVYAFGSNYQGTLGVGDEQMTQSTVPVRVRFPSDDVCIDKVVCAHRHTIALSATGDRLFAWGCGEFGVFLFLSNAHSKSGRLGGGDETDQFAPINMPMRIAQAIDNIYVGEDVSIIGCTDGRLYACGANTNNRLGFNLHMRREVAGCKSRVR